METDFSLKSVTDKLVEDRGFQRPLNIAQAKEVTDALAEAIAGLAADKSKKRLLTAKIFQYLTAGSGHNTHLSGQREGEMIVRDKSKARNKFQKRRNGFIPK